MQIKILSQPNCQNCKMLKSVCPDAEEVVLEPAVLLDIAQKLNVRTLPILVLTGDNGELQNLLRKKED